MSDVLWAIPLTGVVTTIASLTTAYATYRLTRQGTLGADERAAKRQVEQEQRQVRMIERREDMKPDTPIPRHRAEGERVLQS